MSNIFGNWLHGIDKRFTILIMVGEFVIVWSFWLCRNDKVFNGKNLSFILFIYGRLYNILRIVTYYRGVCTVGGYGEGYLLPNIDGSMIFRLDLHPHRRSNSFFMITCLALLFCLSLLNLSDCAHRRC
jgi:hypothetical protein